MERLLAARRAHGWTSAVTKGAPCSFLPCSQQWAWGYFSHMSSFFWAAACPGPAAQGGKGQQGMQAVHSHPRAALGCTSLPVLCLGRELCAEQLLKLKPRMLWRRFSCKRWWGWLLLFAWVEALYTAQTCCLLLGLFIKGFLAPGQQAEVMDQFLSGTLASAMSGGGGEVWQCHQRVQVSSRNIPRRLQAAHPYGKCSPFTLWLVAALEDSSGLLETTVLNKGTLCRQGWSNAWKHHRLLTLPWWNSPRKRGCRFDGVFPSHHPPQWVSFCQQLVLLSCCSVCCKAKGFLTGKLNLIARSIDIYYKCLS